MRTLMRKDWRLVRPILIAAGILWALPLIMGCAYVRFFSWEQPKALVEWLVSVGEMLSLSLMASALTSPIFAGTMFARERRERTAEFVATMPVARVSIVCSKAVVAITASILPWGVTLAVIMLLNRVLTALNLGSNGPMIDYGPATDLHLMAPFFGVLGGGAFMAFGIAWLASTILRSEVLAAACAFLVVVALITSAIMFETGMGARYDLTPLMVASCLGGIGGATFATGVVVALCRASP